MRHVPFMLLALLVTSEGCDKSGAGSSAAATTRDSSGVTIVENPRDVGVGGPHWVVDTTPVLSIGDETGDPAYQLTLIGGLQRLANGMLLVMNGAGESAFEFRFYDSTGKHVATHGRRGNGPGDFRWVSSVQPTGGDTVMAVDFPARRLNWVSASKGYLRSIQIDEQLLAQLIDSGGRSLSEGMTPFGDSLYAMKAWHGGYRDPNAYMSYQIVDLAAKKHILAGRMPDNAAVSPVGNLHVVDKTRRRLCIARGLVAEISCVDATGSRMSIRWVADSIPFTADDRATAEARIRARMNSSNPAAVAEVEKMLARTLWPDVYEPINALQVDVRGNFWVREPQRSGKEPVTYRMRVIDSEGRHIAFASDVPMRSIGHGAKVIIEEDRIVRVYTDRDDLPRIGVFRINRR